MSRDLAKRKFGARFLARCGWTTPALVLITLAAFFIRVWDLASESAWADEAFTYRVAVSSVGGMLHKMRWDLVHPPLYYVLLWIYVRLIGSGITGLRVPSVILGCGAVVLAYFICQELPRPGRAGRRTHGLIAAALIAVSLSSVNWSQEIRSYAMFTALVLALVLWLAVIQRSPDSLGMWALGAGLMSATVNCEYVGGIYVLTTVGALLLSDLHSRYKLRAVGCGLVALALITPWLIFELQVSRYYHGRLGPILYWLPRPSLQSLIDLWPVAFSRSNLLQQTWLPLTLGLLGLAVLVALLALRKDFRRSAPLIALMMNTYLIPVFIWVISRLPSHQSVFENRQLAPSIAMELLLVAYAIELVPWTSRRAGIVQAILGSLLVVYTYRGTAAAFRYGPLRISYKNIAAIVQQHRPIPAYALDFYSQIQPIELYCPGPCITRPPQRIGDFPNQLLLIDRRTFPADQLLLGQLHSQGYTTTDLGDFQDISVLSLSRALASDAPPQSPPIDDVPPPESEAGIHPPHVSGSRSAR